jgi:phage/plasmid-associated DNA primase
MASSKIEALKAKYAAGNYTTAAEEEQPPEIQPVKKVVNSHEVADQQFEQKRLEGTDTAKLLEGLPEEQAAEEAELLATNPSIPFLVIKNALNDGRGVVYFRDGFYRQGKTHYTRIDETLIKRQIIDYLKQKLRAAYSAGIINTTLATFKLQVELSPEEAQERINPPGYFNCTNGILKFNEGGVELLKHGSSSTMGFIFLDKPCVAYDIEASRQWANNLLVCLGEADAPSRINMLGMVAAGLAPNVMRKKIDRIPAMLSVSKPGQNGSSVLMEVLTLLFGKSQVSRLNLREFDNADKHGCRNELYQMQGCRWNFPDENTGAGIRIDGLASLKATLTNGFIDSRNLHQSSFSFKPNIVCHFPMNDTPNINYSDDSVTSRYIGIKWPYIFKSNPDSNNPRHRKADLRFNLNAEGSEAFIRKNVLPGLLLELIDAFYSTLKNGFDRSETLQLFRQSGANDDHVTQFLERFEAVPTNVLADKWANAMPMDELFNRYIAFCIDEGLVLRQMHEGKLLRLTILGHYSTPFDQPKTDPQLLKKHLRQFNKYEFAIPSPCSAKAHGLKRSTHCFIKMNHAFNGDF